MRLPRNRKPAALLLLWGLLFLFPPSVPARDDAPSEKLEKEATVPTERKKANGLASYYADYYNGRKTFSGVRYDPEKMTAAHGYLPMGSKVKVANPVTGAEVTVTVNDRCRKRKFQFIDLSKAAARKLGFFGKGTARVTITPLKGEQLAAADQAPSAPSSRSPE